MISIGLAMDAFAVSICKGLVIKNNRIKSSIIIALYFCLFQMIMPLIGYFLGSKFTFFLKQIDHYLVFGIFLYLGINLLKDRSDSYDEKVDYSIMIPLAVATSIDALGIGISFTLLNINIISAVSVIGIITFIISFLGVIFGGIIGKRGERSAIIFGSILLIFMAFKTLIMHFI